MLDSVVLYRDYNVPVDRVEKGRRGNQVSSKRKIEIFTAGCPLCLETVAAVKKAVASCGCDVVEHNISSQISSEAQRYGVKAVPTIVIDGQIAFERKPSDQEIADLTLIL